MVDSPLLGCTKWPPHCGADSRAVAASVRLSRASVPIKDARASQTLLRFSTESNVSHTACVHTLFYYSISMSHRQPWFFLPECAFWWAPSRSASHQKKSRTGPKSVRMWFLPGRTAGWESEGKSAARSKKCIVCVQCGRLQNKKNYFMAFYYRTNRNKLVWDSQRRRLKSRRIPLSGSVSVRRLSPARRSPEKNIRERNVEINHLHRFVRLHAVNKLKADVRLTGKRVKLNYFLIISVDFKNLISACL